MKDIKSMSTKAIEKEITENRCNYASATNDARRAICLRNHQLMTELDRRYEIAEKQLLANLNK